MKNIFSKLPLVKRVIFYFKDWVFREELYTVLILLFFWAFLFRELEWWHLFDSFYFSVVTLSTVGYWDFTPKTYLWKSFTILYIFIWLGLIASFITKIANISDEYKAKNSHETIKEIEKSILEKFKISNKKSDDKNEKEKKI